MINNCNFLASSHFIRNKNIAQSQKAGSAKGGFLTANNNCVRAGEQAFSFYEG